MNLRSLIIAAVLSVVYSKHAKDETACDGCSGNCAIVPPKDSSKYPCYQGTPEDTKDCFNNDALINDAASWACGNCEEFGYPSYIRNDPIYRKMGLYTTEKLAEEGSKVCDKCKHQCSLVPPAGSPIPCYEGNPADAGFCYNTDPVLAEGTTWNCDKCSEQGFTQYIHNDPVYTNMGLWVKAKN